MKKLLTGILASTMILSSISMSFAQETQVTDHFSQETAVYTQTLASSESDFTMGDGGVITKYTGEGGNVVIPSTIDGRTVYGIGEKAFQNVTSMDSVTMPSTLERIEKSAFSGCTNVRTVNLNDGLYYIGDLAFEKTTNLSSIWIPSTVTDLSYGTFYKSGLTSAYVPQTVKTMGTYVFSECPRLKSVIYMADIDGLPEGTFYKCAQLEEVYLREGTVTIGTAAFRDCTGLKEITLPSTTKTLGPQSFNGCTKLEKMDMTNTVLDTADIGSFANCTSLTEVVFPYGFRVLTVMNYKSQYTAQFNNCTSLQKVVFPSTIQTLYDVAVSPANTQNPMYNCHADLVVHGYPDTKAEKYANEFSTIAFQSRGSVSSENQNPTITPTTAPTLPTAPEVVVPEVTTPDVEGVPDWAQVYVKYALSSGILPNISAGNMDSASSRGLIAQALYNYAGNGANVTPTHNFTDTGDYGVAIAWCYENGLMSGTGNTTFGTYGNVTREQFALILRALAKFEGRDVSGDTSTLSKFSDENLMNDWAKEGIAWAVNAGLMEGNNGKLDPQGSVTQVQVAIMMQNFAK